MYFQDFVCGECRVANLTLKCLFPGMDPFMDGQSSSSVKASITSAAFKRSLITMAFFVNCQFFFCMKPRVANWAFVEIFARVNGLMIIQSSFLTEARVAKFTAERFLSRVDPFVYFQV